MIWLIIAVIIVGFFVVRALNAPEKRIQKEREYAAQKLVEHFFVTTDGKLPEEPTPLNPVVIREVLAHDLWPKALEVVSKEGKASTSLLQRKLRIGYGDAARFIEVMEAQGIVSHANGNRPRDVLNKDLPSSS